MDETRTLTIEEDGPGVPSGGRPALTVLWSVDEPWRAGETCWLDEGEVVLGRGRASFVRARPGREERTEPLGSPRISRDQLRIGGGLVENVGRCPLLLDGRPVTEAPFVPGAQLELRGQLLLLCERRAPMPAAGAENFPFGGADAAGLVGETPELWALRREVAFCAPLDAHALVHGPSGTGKELVARALHAGSRRGRAELVSRNAATFPETLVEAELFGNVAGFPNPGMAARPGLVGAADGSTLFLDEFGELPLSQQVRLLRVLDGGEYTRLGEARPRRADLRLVAATNRPLDALKEDVLARLPLRLRTTGLDERRAVVPLIAAHLLRRLARDEPAFLRFLRPDGHPRWTAALVGALVRHPYTTHTRELSTLLWEALRRATTDVLDLWPSYHGEVRAAPAAVDPRTVGPEEIRAALERHGGKQEAAWRELGLSSRHALGRLVRKYGL